jgi:ketosteroid isomerase-like protein
LPPGNTATHETGVRKAESDWMAAMKSHDVTALGDLSEDQLVLTSPNGEVMGRDDFIGAVANGSLVVQSEEISDEHLADYGNAAVMTGLLKVQATREGNDISGTYRFVDTWIWKKGQWRKAAAVFMSVTQ